ncbi:hypothetical protein KR038_007124 [Drosophila bunnanda]|nr:hypothetical protein KR038_007124 [Drosophila bunnanda]
MPSKKHLGSEGRRRTNRRRAVQLSEFLRGDDEPTGQLPGSPAQSQHTNGSSIGDLTASTVNVSPIATPDTPIGKPEKAPQPSLSPPAPPMPVNAWQLSSSTNDPPQGTFRPDHKAFPDLGKQAKKIKTTATPETKHVTRSLDSSKARRDCPVLGNFLPKPLLAEEADGKDQASTSWLSSFPSTSDKCQGTKLPSCSPSRITVLKRATPQHWNIPGCSQQAMSMHPEISPQKRTLTAVVAAATVPALKKGPIQQKEQHKKIQNSTESSSEKKSKNPVSKAKGKMQSEICPEPASTSALAAPAVPSMEWRQSHQKEQYNQQKSPKSASEKTLESPCCSSEAKVQMQSEITSRETASTAPLAAPAVPSMEWRPTQQIEQHNRTQRGPETSSKKMQSEISPREPVPTPPIAAPAVPSMEWRPTQQIEQHNRTQRGPETSSKKMQSEISPREPAPTPPIAAPAVLSMEWRKSPVNSSEISQSPGCSSEPKTQMQSEIRPREPASTPAVAGFAVRSMEWGPSQQMQPQEGPENFPNPTGLSNPNMPENPPARERRPLVEFQAGEEYVVLASQFSTENRDQNPIGNPSSWKRSEYTALQNQTVEQTGERETAGGLFTPIRSLLNANAQEFHPMARKSEREQWYPAGEHAQQPNESRLTVSNINQGFLSWRKLM